MAKACLVVVGSAWVSRVGWILGLRMPDLDLICIGYMFGGQSNWFLGGLGGENDVVDEDCARDTGQGTWVLCTGLTRVTPCMTVGEITGTVGMKVDFSVVNIEEYGNLTSLKITFLEM